MGEPDPQQRRGPGRPRKWANNAERMRAYRTQQRAETEQLRRADGRGELLDELHDVTAQRDQLAAEVEVLRARVRHLEGELRQRRTTPRPPAPAPPSPPARRNTPASPPVSDEPRLSRAERRRLEREQRRRTTT